MRVLIIDSHKGSDNTIPQNLHWKNAKILSDYLGADLIWSYPSVNDNIKSNYDIIIFVHASHYAYTDYEWINRSPDAKLFYITNEYNLGEPRTLWTAAKDGRKYAVIANHPPEPSKIVMKYVNEWHNINLNALIYKPVATIQKQSLFETKKEGCVYYGSFRKERAIYFNKYLNGHVQLSTHQKNIDKFRKCGVTSNIIGRINWDGEGLSTFAESLYIEDTVTHKYYNHLANRFYEALNYDCTPIFGVECINTIEKSGYNIGSEYVIDDPINFNFETILKIKPEWHEMALGEKQKALNRIAEICLNG